MDKFIPLSRTYEYTIKHITSILIWKEIGIELCAYHVVDNKIYKRSPKHLPYGSAEYWLVYDHLFTWDKKTIYF